jgi:hypothetical protein
MSDAQSPADQTPPTPADVPAVMANGTPLTEQQMQNIVQALPLLDPDLELEVKRGNTAILTAVGAGATTPMAIAQVLVQMGMTQGLPQGVQGLVDEQLKLAREKQLEEEETAKRRAGLLVGMAGAALGLGALGAGGEGAGDTAAKGEKLFDSILAREALFSGMTMERWAGMTEPQKAEHIAMVKQGSEELMDQAVDKFKEVDTKLHNTVRAELEKQGYSGEDLDKKVEETVREIKLATTPDKTLTGATEEERKADLARQREAQISTKLDEDWKRQAARDYALANDALYGASNTKTDVVKADDAFQQKDDAGVVKNLDSASKRANETKAVMEQLSTAAPEVQVQKAGSVFKQADEGFEGGARYAATEAEKSQFIDDRDANLDARKTVYDTVSAAQKRDDLAVGAVASKMNDEAAFGDAPAQVAAAPQPVERKTVDLDVLKLSGQVQEPGVGLEVAAANDPSAAAGDPEMKKPDPQKLAVSRPSGGMTGSPTG